MIPPTEPGSLIWKTVSLFWETTDNFADKILKALEKAEKQLEISVVVGGAFSYLQELEQNFIRSKDKINVYKNISSQKMAELICMYWTSWYYLYVRM